MAAMRSPRDPGAKARELFPLERGPFDALRLLRAGSKGPLFHVDSGQVDLGQVDSGRIDLGQSDSVLVDLRIAFSIRAHMASTPFTLVRMSQS
jgi:hypothetical protein